MKHGIHPNAPVEGCVRALSDDTLVLGGLFVLACKSDARRCRVLGSARELPLRTGVRDEEAGR